MNFYIYKLSSNISLHVFLLRVFLCSLGSKADQVVTRPLAAAETRWAGLLPQIVWMNEFSNVLQLYKKDLAKNCPADDHGEVYEAKEFLDEYEWIMVFQLDADLRPVGLFIATMEASKKVT